MNWVLHNGGFEANICVVFGPNLFDWAEVPVTRRSERAQRKGNAAPKQAAEQSPRPDLIGPQVGTPPITIGAFERQGACPQLVFESCASALHFRKLVKVRSEVRRVT